MQARELADHVLAWVDVESMQDGVRSLPFMCREDTVRHKECIFFP